MHSIVSIKTFLYSGVALASLVIATPALSGPQGGVVSDGTASISQNGKITDIHQSSHKAIIDWQSFNIASDETTQFHQPSSSAIALNRIHDANPSQIDGVLKANGHIMLINGNGVVFGSGARVDVGSLTVSTADIDNDDFMAGNYDFKHAGASDAAIKNYGHITAKNAGLVSLVAPIVENHGVIAAKMGKVQLAAADKFTLDLAGDGLIQIAVSDEEATKLAQNTGTIQAESGVVALTATKARHIVDSLVENKGTIIASSMTKRGGKVILGGGNVKVSGTIKADGKTGGGEILIGGDYQGAGAEDGLEIAQNTLITDEAVITANATDTGDGGKVIVWADKNTGFYGQIEAKGGPNGGDGGFVEVSGKQYLDFNGDVDLSGDTLGTLLLDPDDLDIVAGTANPSEFSDDMIAFAENSGGTSTIGATTITNRLSANANVILQANNTIDVNAAITSTGSGDLTLRTAAGGTITINAAIDVNTGSLYIRGDEIDIAANLSGAGFIQLNSADINQQIEIGSSIGAALNLEAAELAFLQNGWNRVTIGSTDHAAPIFVNEAVSFSDHAYLRNAQPVALVNHAIDINNDITTTDNADLYLYGRADATSPHAWNGVNIGPGADINVARNFYSSSSGNDSHFFANSFNVGGDVTIVAGANTSINSDIVAGGNFTVTHSSGNPSHEFSIANSALIDVGGDINITSSGSAGDFVMAANTAMEADGDITLTTNGLDINNTAQIRSGSGTSNLTFLETGQNSDMEIGGTSHGATWQMEASEVDTIQEGFSTITFGSTSHTGGIIFSGDISFSDDVIFRQDQVNATGDINRDVANGVTPTITVTDSGDLSFYTVSTSVWNNIRANVAGNLLLDGFLQTGLADLDVTGNLDIQNTNQVVIHSAQTQNIGGNATISATNWYRQGVAAGAFLNVDGNIDITSREVQIFTGSTINGNVGGTSNLTFREYGNDGDMELGGTAVGSTWQMEDHELAAIQDGFNSVTFGSTGATGNISIQSWDMSALSHDLTLNGGAIETDALVTGGNSLSIHANTGDITLNADANLGYTVGSFTTQGGNITLHADHDNNNDGFIRLINGMINTNGGNFTAGGGANPLSDYAWGNGTVDDGVVLDNIDITTGAGNISLYGHGRDNAAGSYQNGIAINNGSTLTTTTGNITLNGVGGAGDDGGRGIYVGNTGTLITSASGTISLTGQGGSAGGAGNNISHGIHIQDAAKITSTGTGAGAATITLHGTAGNGEESNTGVVIEDTNTEVTSIDGAISITGLGSSNGAGTSVNNHGVLVYDGAQVSSTGTGANAATITLDGTGGAGQTSNRGVYIGNLNALVTSVDGAIDITGRGGSNGAVGALNNHGVLVVNSGKITSTGTGINAATITVDGTGAAGEDSNVGIFVSLANSEITSVDGNISLTGRGGSNGIAGSASNHGITVTAGGKIRSTGTTTDAALITLNGTGGAGEDSNIGVYLGDNNSEITSVLGAIDITGQGGGTGAAGSNGNYGIYVLLDADITSTGTGANAATITLDGTAGVGEDQNRGVYFNNVGTTLTSVDGAINITGRGGSNGSADSDGNYGVTVNNGAVIQSTGTGVNAATITIDGTGANGEDSNIGTYLINDALITSVDGAIDITGQGGSNGTNLSSDNYGIFISAGADITSTGTGTNAATITLDGTAGAGEDANMGVNLSNAGSTITSVDGAISITGQGGSRGLAGSNNNHGIRIIGGAGVTSTGTGADAATITLDGTGGNGEDTNIGIVLENLGTVVTSVDGNISFTGQGGTSGTAGSDNSRGVSIANGAVVSSTGATTDAATLTFTGTGGAARSSGLGILLYDADISSAYGDMLFTGTGNSGGAADSIYNLGIQISAGNTITSTGTGANAATITLNGTAGDGQSNNMGILLDGSSTITSTDGDISLTGQGGTNGSVTSERNYGMHISGGSVISSIGTGTNAATITLDGTGGDGQFRNDGIRIGGSPTTRVTSDEGNISLTGRGGSNGDVDSDTNIGVYIVAGGGVTSTGTGADAATITIDGTGGAGDDGNRGFLVQNAGSIVTSAEGAIQITGRGNTHGIGANANNIAIDILDNGTISTTGGATDITFIGDSFYIDATGTVSSTDDVSIRAITTSSDIGLGSGSGALRLSSTELAQFAIGNRFIIGDSASGTGAVDIDGWDFSAESYDVEIYGGSITGNEFASGSNSVTLAARTGDISLTSDTNLDYKIGSFTTQGGNITLNADQDGNSTGAIKLVGGTITTNGGNFTAGGGANPLTTAAHASQDSTYDIGAFIVGTGISTGTGNIVIRGEGEDTGNGNTGILIQTGGSLATTTGGIILHGVGGSGEDENRGILVNASSITSAEGSISLNGTGGSNGAGTSDENRGVFLLSSSVTSTGTGANASTIVIDGTGASNAGGRFNRGVNISGTTISSIDGNISITGQGGSSGIAGSNGNEGILIFSNSDIISTGTGANAATITLDGTGANGQNANRGVTINSAGTTVTSVVGDISITGQAGSNGAGNSINNYGIALIGGAAVSSTGTGVDAATITIDGTGGNGDENNFGISITDLNTLITSVDGAIDITGRGGSNGNADSNWNRGIYVASQSVISSTGTGANAATITLNGTGGNGEDNNFGVNITNTALVTSVDGNISFTGQGGSNGTNLGTGNYGVVMANGGDVTSTGTTIDAATITFDGTAGAGQGSNNGVQIQNAGTLVTSVVGNIDITGQASSNGLAGSNFNYGIQLLTGAVVSSTGTGVNAATITLDGTGGSGESYNTGIVVTGADSEITAIDGDISLTGQGGTDGTVNGLGNMGILVNGTAEINSTGTGVHAAQITLDGTGATAQTDNRGVIIANAEINSIDGNITVTGEGASNGAAGSNTNYGVFVHTAGKIRSTGTGANAATITLDGTAGAGEDDNRGVSIESANTEITSVDGNISITGQGASNGNAGSNFNYGILMASAAEITSTGTGANAATITLTGTAGAGDLSNNGIFITGNASMTNITSVDGNISLTGNAATAFSATSSDNRGILIDTTGHITSTGTGQYAATITLNGTGADGDDNNYGIVLNDARINAVDGAIDLTGRGGSAGGVNSSQNYGIYVHTGSQISSTGIGANAATITMDGTGGAGDDNNYGVFFTIGNAEATSVDGAIDITGRGGSNGLAGSSFNSGIAFVNSGRIRSTGVGAHAATITLNGTGGNGQDGNRGVLMRDSASRIESAQGNVNITAQGHGAGIGNYGFYSLLSADIDLNNGASLTMNGTGSNAAGSTNGDGVRLENTGTSITAENGHITLIGTSLRDEVSADGLIINDDASILSTGTGNINVTGRTAGSGYGVRILNNSANITHTGTGNVSVTGSGSTSGNDLVVTHAQIDTTGGVGSDVTLRGDSLLISGTGDIDASGELTIQPFTSSTSIGVGGGSGDLNIDDTELALFSSTGKLTIGSTASTGLVTIDSVNLDSNGDALEIIGGSIVVDNGLDADTSLTLVARNNLTLNSAVSANGGGNSVVLVANQGTFTNNAGVNAVDTGAGRRLIYATSQSSIQGDALSEDGHLYNRTYVGNAPATITQTGDQFIYSYQPTITFTANNVNLDAYTPNFSNFTSRIAGLVSGDALGEAIDSGTIVLTKSRIAPGRYRININGNHASEMGYGFDYVDGFLTMPTAASRISPSVQRQIQPNQVNTPQRSPIQTVTYSTRGEDGTPQNRVEIVRMPEKYNNQANHSSTNAGIRLATSDKVEITPAVTTFFDLCNFDGRYCGD